MNPSLQRANEFAKDYDRKTKERAWHGPDILFGLMYEYLNPHDTLLDIGIETGQSSFLFQKAGLKIYGVDGSSEMLKICRKKGIGCHLIESDFLNKGIPINDITFNHIISNAVFHLIWNIDEIFGEVYRLLISEGIFGFTLDEKINSDSAYQKTNIKGIYESTIQNTGITTYMYDHRYVNYLLKKYKFKLLKKTRFLAFKGTEDIPDFYFTACITRSS